MGLCDASLNKLAALMELMFLLAKLLMDVRTVDADVVRSDDTGLEVTPDDDVSANNVAGEICCCPLFNGKFSCKMLAAGDVESPGSLLSDKDVIGPFVREMDDVNIELAPLIDEVDVALCCC